MKKLLFGKKKGTFALHFIVAALSFAAIDLLVFFKGYAVVADTIGSLDKESILISTIATLALCLLTFTVGLLRSKGGLWGLGLPLFLSVAFGLFALLVGGNFFAMLLLPLTMYAVPMQAIVDSLISWDSPPPLYFLVPILYLMPLFLPFLLGRLLSKYARLPQDE